MVTAKEVKVVPKSSVPTPPKPAGEYAFLKEMGQKLEKEQALQVSAKDLTEARRTQARWRSYFKGTSGTRRVKAGEAGAYTVFLWMK